MSAGTLERQLKTTGGGLSAYPRIAAGRGLFLLFVFATALACRRDSQPDAYGNFEADEVSVSAQTSGQLMTFTPTEGMQLAAGAVVGLVDTTQLALERAQMIAQREATSA